MAQDNKGRPGMEPSPNQRIVLDNLVERCSQMDELTPNGPGVDIDNLARYLETNQIGGIFTRGKFYPWHRSTVRDHLTALYVRRHVTRCMVGGRIYYRPAVVE